MEKKWNSGEILKFFDHLEKYPILWDNCHAEFKSRSLKDEAYSHLLNDLQEEGFPETITVDYLKDRLKNLRDTYSAEAKKVLAFPLAEGRDYKPKLLWFDKADSFLRPTITRKKCIARVTLRGKPKRCLTIDGFDENGFPEGSCLENVEPVKNIRTKTVDHVISPIEKSSEYSSAEFDEYDYFGKIVAITLRKLNQEDAWKAEDEISKVLRKYKRRKRQIFTDFIEVSPEHLLSDQFILNNASSSSDCQNSNLENAPEVSSMCSENENPQPSKRPCIKVIKVKSDESKDLGQQVYLVS